MLLNTNAAPSKGRGRVEEGGLAKGQVVALVGGILSSHEYHSR